MNSRNIVGLAHYLRPTPTDYQTGYILYRVIGFGIYLGGFAKQPDMDMLPSESPDSKRLIVVIFNVTMRPAPE